MSNERQTPKGIEIFPRRLKRPVLGGDHRGGRRSMLGVGGSGATTTPCAACKLLRRRCAEECPFSPYFSPHEPQKFACVHKVFGASNVSKMLMEFGDNIYHNNVQDQMIRLLQYFCKRISSQSSSVRAEHALDDMKFP